MYIVYFHLRNLASCYQIKAFVRNLLAIKQVLQFSCWTSCYNISNTFKLVKLFGLFAFPALLQAISHVVNDRRMSGVSLTSSFNGNLSLGDGRCRLFLSCPFLEQARRQLVVLVLSFFLEQASGCGGCGEAWEARLAKPGQRATTVLSSRYQTIHLFFFPSFLSLEARSM